MIIAAFVQIQIWILFIIIIYLNIQIFATLWCSAVQCSAVNKTTMQCSAVHCRWQIYTACTTVRYPRRWDNTGYRGDTLGIKVGRLCFLVWYLCAFICMECHKFQEKKLCKPFDQSFPLKPSALTLQNQKTLMVKNLNDCPIIDFNC